MSIRTTDTLGIVTTRENPAQPLKAHYFMEGRSNTGSDSSDVFVIMRPSNSTHPPLIIGATNTANISNAGKDVAWSIGPNYMPGGSRYDNNWSAWALAFEDHFVNSLPRLGLTFSSEFHAPIWTPRWKGSTLNTGNDQMRLISFVMDDSARVGNLSIGTDILYINRIGGSAGFSSYQSSKVASWIIADFYGKTWDFGDTITTRYDLPQVGIPIIQFRNAANSAYVTALQADASNRLVLAPGGAGLYTYGDLIFSTKKTITTDDGSEVEIGNSSKKSYLSIYAPSTQVLQLRSNTGGSNLWNTFVNSDNIAWARPDGSSYFQMYTSAPHVIGANDRIGIGGSPANTLDVYGTARIRTMTGTATTLAGLNGNNEVSSITVSSPLSLSGNVLSVTSGSYTGSGAANQVTYWTGTSAFAGSANYLFDGTSKVSLIAAAASTSTDPASKYIITSGSSWLAGVDNSAADRYKISLGSVLGTNDRFYMDTTGKATFYHNVIANNQNANVVTIGSVTSSESYPGIWFGSATPTLSNYAFLADVGANKTILNAPSGGLVSFGLNNSEKMRLTSTGLSIQAAANAVNPLDVEGAVAIGAAYSGTSTGPTNGAIIEGAVGIGNNSPGVKLHVTTTAEAGTAIQRWENASADVNLFVAAASPEGSITGNPGDMVLRTDAGNGKLYIKETGTGNTGWLDQSGGGGGSSYYQTLRDDGTGQTQRGKVNFVGTSTVATTLTDDSGNDETEVALSVPTDGITATQIAADAVGSSEIATDAVGAAEIAADAVGSSEIAAGAVDASELAATTVSAGDYTGGVFTFDADGRCTAAANGAIISPSQITSDQNNYTPTGWSTSTVAFVTGDATIRAITGFGSLATGTVRTIVNTGTSPLYIPGEHPSSTAGNRVTTPVDQILAPNGGSITIVYNGTTSRWFVVNNNFNPAVMASNGVNGHYYNCTVGATTGADWGTIGFASASGGNSTSLATSTLPAGWDINTASSATGASSLYLSKTVVNPTEFGSSHMVASVSVNFPTLSDGSQTYTFQFGMVATSSSTTLAVNNSVAIRYSSGINSGKFEGFSRNNSGTESTVDLGVTVAATTNYLLTVCYDKARSEARFYINGAYAGRVTGSMPNSNIDCGARAIIVKSAGTTSRSAVIPTFTFFTVYGS